jgi:hypothetical protein
MSKKSDWGAHRKQRLEIVYQPIDELKPDPANPRQHGAKQIATLAKASMRSALMCRSWSILSSM